MQSLRRHPYAVLMTCRLFLQITLISLAPVFYSQELCAGEPTGEPGAKKVIALWPAGNPDGWTIELEEERTDDGIVRVKNVRTPTLSYYPPTTTATHQAMIICPGGGYSILAIDHEGIQVARFLASHGIHCFVLKYRLPKKEDPSRHHVALQDAQRAVSLVRYTAKEYQIDSKQIGIMGFSAGGHLSAAASTQFNKRHYNARDDIDKTSCRPDFTALIYPAYLVDKENLTTMAEEITVTKDTPTAFLAHTCDDGVPADSSIQYYLALRKHKIPGRLCIYPDGGHGYGLRKRDKLVGQWIDNLAAWLEYLRENQ